MSYKELDPNTDILYSQKTEVEELFYPDQAITKPYNSGNNIVIETTDPPAEDPDEYNEVTYVKNENTNINYYSFARGEKDNFEAGDHTGLMYSYMRSLLFPRREYYRVDDDNSQFNVETIDVISVTREWYRDSLDPNFFAIFINTEASTPTSAVSSFSTGDNILGLFPSSKSFQSLLGEKRYLYPTTSNDTLYDPSTDSLTMVGDDDLNTDKPYGEILIESGLIILYTDVITDEHGNVTDDSVLHYVAGIAGRSRTQINATVYYCRATNSEFNFSTNRTFYREDAENVIKPEFRENPVTFITSIGLFNDKNQCIAYGRVSQPLKKDFTRERNFTAEINL